MDISAKLQISILLGDLVDSARLSGYLNCKLNKDYSEKLNQEYEQERQKTIKLRQQITLLLPQI